MLLRVIMFIMFMSSINSKAQSFLNPDLEGSVDSSSSLPYFWQNVPYTDVNCNASSYPGDTPDLTNLFGPVAWGGILGNPYSGDTFVSGVISVFNHEGIMQEVSGFIPNEFYVIHFYQAVVKNSGAIDKSGSWGVFIDDILAGITSPTHSNAEWNSTSFSWESRVITFKAINESHLIKFLPQDDDLNGSSSLNDTTAALRMGIDSISITKCNYKIDLGIDKIICKGELIVLDAETIGASYLWQDSSTVSSIESYKEGVYWVTVKIGFCEQTDSLIVYAEDCNLLIELPNVITPNGDGVNDMFRPLNNNVISAKKTCIYNRWGKLVFETNNPLIEWGGEDNANGTYFWVIQYFDVLNNLKRSSGYITVLH